MDQESREQPQGARRAESSHREADSNWLILPKAAPPRMLREFTWSPQLQAETVADPPP
jgi:hypothetical protein